MLPLSTVRSNTADRLVSVARLVVFGLLAAILGTVALVLLAVALVRVLHSYLPGGVWVATGSDNTLVHIDPRTGAVLATLPGAS